MTPDRITITLDEAFHFSHMEDGSPVFIDGDEDEIEFIVTDKIAAQEFERAIEAIG